MYNLNFHSVVISCAEDAHCSRHSLCKCEEEGKSEMAHKSQGWSKGVGKSMVERTLLSNRVGGNNMNTSSFKFALSNFEHFPYNVEILTANVSYDFSQVMQCFTLVECSTIADYQFSSLWSLPKSYWRSNGQLWHYEGGPKKKPDFLQKWRFTFWTKNN